ncbi:unnamed protein product [Zymoseptoria tritici ST99CH_3D1]|nr:unnamed protein product [Zymoseptoria tritici ST99CH_3D1]
MASLPARQPSQSRRPATSEQPSQSPASASSQAAGSSQSHASSSPVRARSGDSQTIFVHKPDEEDIQIEQELELGSQQAPQAQEEEEDEKRCWICFSDQSEDTPTTSPWRDPCPCALVAHEECLLDWIADLEAPGQQNRRGEYTTPKCPQCKAEIKLSRSTDLIVDASRAVDRIKSKVVTPTVLAMLSGGLHYMSTAWGIHSIYAVFGAEDGHRILRPVLYNTIRAPVEVYVNSPRHASRVMLDLFLDRLQHWRLYLGLPLIGPVLILSRMSFADSILPVLPIFFFATQNYASNDTVDLTQWPPSASFAFALLPYARAAYNAYYQRFWAEKEKQWLKEVQPRAGQNSNEAAGGNAADGNAAPQGNADDNVVEVHVDEIRVDGGIFGDWEVAIEEIAAGQPNDAPPPNRNNDGAAAPAPVIRDGRIQPYAERLAGQLVEAEQDLDPEARQQQPAADPQPAQQPEQPAERRLATTGTAIAGHFVGALMFPTVAGLAGEFLKLVLPTSWTAPSTAVKWLSWNGDYFPKKGGFFQAKWARSLVGGCLFVVCKDALRLYVRWRMAQMHRTRKVLNVERRSGRMGRV